MGPRIRRPGSRSAGLSVRPLKVTARSAPAVSDRNGGHLLHEDPGVIGGLAGGERTFVPGGYLAPADCAPARPSAWIWSAFSFVTCRSCRAVCVAPANYGACGVLPAVCCLRCAACAVQLSSGLAELMEAAR